MNFFGKGVLSGIPKEVVEEAISMANDPELLSFVKAALPGVIARSQGEINATNCGSLGTEAMYAGMAALSIARANIKTTLTQGNEFLEKEKARNEN